ncbi:hypothetical protein MGLY_20460 [Neomoorella glycerini]|uniref:Uncharacterized protein n=1 Tax=Neomoorella glycerini TaxID=55779 RepID=A0A6I5ZSG7_9FIRM|nr:hypothetical protein [Moorella glycerini]QGP92658.1 hypothetical protein MGLY_20460 [Moorella glycerini]
MLAVVILHNVPANSNFLLTNTEFILTYFGILLGLVIAVVSLITPVIERILEKLNQVTPRIIKGKARNLYDLTSLINELKEDTLFVFYFFVITLGTSILAQVRWSKISELSLLSVNVYELVQVTIIILSLFTIHDILHGMFKILEVMTFLASRLHNEKKR